MNGPRKLRASFSNFFHLGEENAMMVPDEPGGHLTAAQPARKSLVLFVFIQMVV